MPAHCKRRHWCVSDLPGDVDPPDFIREGAVLAGVGGKLVERHSDALCGRWFQPSTWPLDEHTFPYQVFDVCELTFNKERYLHALPIAFDQQVLAGGKTVKPVGEARNKRRRVGLFAVCRATACTTARRFLAR